MKKSVGTNTKICRKQKSQYTQSSHQGNGCINVCSVTHERRVSCAKNRSLVAIHPVLSSRLSRLVSSRHPPLPSMRTRASSQTESSKVEVWRYLTGSRHTSRVMLSVGRGLRHGTVRVVWATRRRHDAVAPLRRRRSRMVVRRHGRGCRRHARHASVWWLLMVRVRMLLVCVVRSHAAR